MVLNKVIRKDVDFRTLSPVLYNYQPIEMRNCSQYMTCYVAKKLKYDKCDFVRFLRTGRSVYVQKINF